MLKIYTNCQNCNCALPNESEQAMICSFECTFCHDCAMVEFKNVCPNCGGGFQKRPSRPKSQLDKYPIAGQGPFKPAGKSAHQKLLEQYENTNPYKR